MSLSKRPELNNIAARRLFLDRHALSDAPNGSPDGADLLALIDRIGFVQVDSINTVARAHDMILFSRCQRYRPTHLKPLLETDRSLFEHWTHDASIIPVSNFANWKTRFDSDAEVLRKQWRNWRRDGFELKSAEVLQQVRDHGPVTSSDVGKNEKRSSGGWWDWHPSKTALEYLWRTGALSVTRRDGFQKVYDLTERVIPEEYRTAANDWPATIDWACTSALARLGFGTPREIAAFWQAATVAEAKAWCDATCAKGDLIEIDLAGAQGYPSRRVFARPDVVAQADRCACAPSRIRVLSPFDPALRDRARTEHLFGFHYRIEVFVPAAKRRYGYYVFPLLEGDRLIGRVDMKCDRSRQQLVVRAVWPEEGIAFGKGRQARLQAELARVARFADCLDVTYTADWLRSASV